MERGRKIIIIAGPNGAGKTTFAREFLPNEAGCPVFVNADLIAAGLAPFAPHTAAVQAGRLMLQALARHFAAGESFAFETTLSGRGYVLPDDVKAMARSTLRHRVLLRPEAELEGASADGVLDGILASGPVPR